MKRSTHLFTYDMFTNPILQLQEDHLELDDASLLRRVIGAGLGVHSGRECVGTRTRVRASLAGGLRPFPKPGTGGREVENYVAAPIDADLQRRLGLFLARNPEMTEEEAIAHLLDVALDTIEGETTGDVSLERAAFRVRVRLLRYGVGDGSAPVR